MTQIGSTLNDALRWVEERLGSEGSRQQAETMFDALMSRSYIEFLEDGYYASEDLDDAAFQLVLEHTL